jgi:nitrous oxidase accessory protein NosD
MLLKFSRFAFLVTISVIPFSRAFAADGTAYRVPEQFASIQEAVNAASPGDTVRVGPGTWCGAVITKPISVVGDGKPVITNQGCAGPNAVFGFLLPAAGASGTSIRGFDFALTSVFPSPSFGVYGRGADLVVVEDNSFNGASFAIHNENGSGWQVNHNKIYGAFEGIVFYRRCQLGTRALDNSAAFNSIGRGLTDGNGIWLFGQDGAVVKNNSIEIPSSPNPPFPFANSWGVLVADDVNPSRCATSLTSINSVIVNNDGRNAGTAVLVLQDFSGSSGNSAGSQFRGNFGINAINVGFFDDSFTTVRNRSKSIECDDQGNCS